MANKPLTLASLVLLTGTLCAQGPGLFPTTNWLAAHNAVLGANTNSGWLRDLNVEDLEVYTTADQTLVLVDRSAELRFRTPDDLMRTSLLGLAGTKMDQMAALELISGNIWHGTYAGKLGGAPAQMHQYVQLEDGSPVALVRVISRGNSSAFILDPGQEEHVAGLIGEPFGTERVAVMGR